MSNPPELVTLTIDDKQVTVPKGTNLIEAARLAGVEIPHYCYHPNLSIAGNCRMCQVKIEGAPKLAIGCNTGATQGMVVRTQHSAPEVEEAQRATLEFLLINHPLDCTVCDQAGHCKLQDYYYDYNGEASRFTEEKVHKVKAFPIGPNVVYDGERCIVCTRCVRFCDEVTETSELGVFNRGDNAVIGIHPGRELNNPLSGTVVDLCPVGALTHREWRFNTRIWYTDTTDSICPGCSTGCNTKVAVRDGKVVQLKARLNEMVNKEWLCDEGRYGSDRFVPEARSSTPMVRSGTSWKEASWPELTGHLGKLAGQQAQSAALFLSPMLTLEEVWVALEFSKSVMGISQLGDAYLAMQLRQRTLTDVEKVLISPDYAPNARALEALGVLPEGEDFRVRLQARYEKALAFVREGKAKQILMVGDFSVLDSDADEAFLRGVAGAEISVALTPRAVTLAGAHTAAHVVLPARTVLEKSGIFVNAQLRFQRARSLLQGPAGSLPEWVLLSRLAQQCKKPPLLGQGVNDERALFREMVARVPAFKGLSLMRIGELGITISELAEAKEGTAAVQPSAAV